LGLTNLYLASLRSELGRVKTEIGRGVYQVEPKIKSGFTPFWITIRKNYHHIADHILKSGVLVDVNSSLKLNNRTVLFDITEQTPAADPFLKHLFQDKSYKIEVNNIDKDQVTLLHQAAKYKNVLAAKLFLETGIKTNDENKYGDTALHIAVDNKHHEMVQVLSARKYPDDPTNTEIYVDLDHINSRSGQGALHNAVSEICFDIVETMLTAGANVDLQETTMNKTPLYLCVEKFLGLKPKEEDIENFPDEAGPSGSSDPNNNNDPSSSLEGDATTTTTTTTPPTDTQQN